MQVQFDGNTAVTSTTDGISKVSRSRFEVLVEKMKQIKKVELHLHLGGAWPLDYLKEIADPTDFTELSDNLELIRSGVNYEKAFEVFPMIGKIVNTDQKIENGVVALCKELAGDNVTCAEFRTGLKDLGSGLEGYLNAVLRGMEKGSLESGIKLGLVLSLRRDTPKDIAEKTIDLAIKYREKGIVGIDLSGDSTKGDGREAVEAILRAKENGFPVTLHIGESPKETKAQQLWELNKIQPQRLGHGVHLYDEAAAWMRHHNVPLEMCLSSAVQVQMISEAKEHPGLKLFKEKHPVFICTDDPLVFQVSLSEECARAAQLLDISVEEVKKLQILAMERSFIK